MNKVICITLCVAMFVGNSLAISCYTCGSLAGIPNNCAVPDQSTLQMANCKVCVKTSTNLLSVTSTSRSCAASCSPSGNVFCCSGNLCNGASGPRLSLLLGGLAALLGLSLARL